MRTRRWRGAERLAGGRAGGGSGGGAAGGGGEGDGRVLAGPRQGDPRRRGALGALAVRGGEDAGRPSDKVVDFYERVMAIEGLRGAAGVREPRAGLGGEGAARDPARRRGWRAARDAGGDAGGARGQHRRRQRGSGGGGVRGEVAIVGEIARAAGAKSQRGGRREGAEAAEGSEPLCELRASSNRTLR